MSWPCRLPQRLRADHPVGPVASTGSSWPLWVAGAAVVAMAWPVAAQTRNTSVSLGVDSRVSLNANSSLGGRDKPWWTTEVTPSIRLESRSGRVVGSLDYGLTLATQSRGEDRAQAVNRLGASFNAEAVPQHFFIEGQAAISQQSNSAHGAQYAPGSSTGFFDGRNLTEVGTASLSPVLRGVVGGAVNVEARLMANATNTRDSLVGDQLQTGGRLSASSAIPGTLITWHLSASSLETDYRVGRSTRNDTALLSLGWLVDADLTLSARGGTEKQNVQDLEGRRTNTWGVGASWRPSPRTRVQLDVDDRYFGRGYSGVIEYRMPRSSFSLRSSRDSSNGFGNNVEPRTAFELFMSRAAAEIPNPVEREAAVRAQLAALGIDPNSIAIPGFVVGAVSVTENHQLNWSWSGQRLSASVQLYRTRTEAIDRALTDVAREPVQQSGYMSNVSYRLTPNVSLGAGGSRLMTRATSTQGATDLKSLSLTLTQRLGLRTTLAASSRYSVFNSLTEPYREAAVTVSLGHRF